MTKHSSTMHKAPGSSLHISKHPANLYLVSSQTGEENGPVRGGGTGPGWHLTIEDLEADNYAYSTDSSAWIQQLSVCVVPSTSYKIKHKLYQLKNTSKSFISVHMYYSDITTRSHSCQKRITQSRIAPTAFTTIGRTHC